MFKRTSHSSRSNMTAAQASEFFSGRQASSQVLLPNRDKSQKRFTFNPRRSLLLFAAFVTVTLLDARTSSGQSQNSVKLLTEVSKGKVKLNPLPRVRAKASRKQLSKARRSPQPPLTQ